MSHCFIEIFQVVINSACLSTRTKMSKANNFRNTTALILSNFAQNQLKPVNKISISGMLTSSHLAEQKVEPRWPNMEGNFLRQFQSYSRSCTSFSLLYTFLIFSLFGFASKTFPTMEKAFRRNITRPILCNRVFKRIQNCCVASEMC